MAVALFKCIPRNQFTQEFGLHKIEKKKANSYHIALHRRGLISTEFTEDENQVLVGQNV